MSTRTQKERPANLEIDLTDRLCISGLTGTGKTILMRYLLTLADDFYIIDPLDQYKEFGEIGDVLQDGKRWVPREESPREFESICQKFHAISNRILVVEEAEQYMPQGRPMLTYTSSLVRMGRNWGIGIWGTTRRIQDINKRFFDLAQRVFFFRCGFKSREYIADMLGNEYMYPRPNPKINRTGYTITTLPPYHFLHFDLEKETAQVMTLKLGTRVHLETAGKKSEAGKEMVEAVAEQPAPDQIPEKSEGPEQTERGAEPWSPRRRQ